MVVKCQLERSILVLKLLYLSIGSSKCVRSGHS